MICPQCGGEFRDGIERCPDCLVDLVPTLPPRIEEEHPEVVELLRSADVPLLMVARSLLDSAEIPYSVQGDQALGLITVLPSGGFGTPEAFAARIFVPEDRHAEAVELLRESDLPDEMLS